MAGKFVAYTGKDGKHYFRLKAGNGEVIFTSQGYAARKSCLNGIESVRTNSPNDDRYDRLTATNGSPYFVLKAANGEVIGKSEMYNTAKAMEAGIASVKKNGTTNNSPTKMNDRPNAIAARQDATSARSI